MTETIAFIGGGRMAGSLIGGMCQAGTPAQHIRVGEPDADQRRSLRDKYDVVTAGDNADAIDGARWIVLAVKPQIAPDICAALPVRDDQVVLSIMAGIPVDVLQQWLPHAMGIARAMPNTPALRGLGATGLYCPASLHDALQAQARAMLETVGTVVTVDTESHLDAVTALSGSGPAYVFALVEAMTDAGAALGLSTEQADVLARATLIGAAGMVEGSGESPGKLRAQVTSPGGTTEAALDVFRDSGLAELVEQAMRAAAARSVELGRASRTPDQS